MKKVAVGSVFGRLTVNECLGTNHLSKRMWLCVCTCGTLTKVRDNDLKSGNTKSCGCLHAEATSARNHRHGFGSERLAQVWRDMLFRCRNVKCPSYPNYGGRGVKVCLEWENYLTFRGAVGQPPGRGFSLDRIDNDGDYEPGNVRWATNKEQALNKRTTVYLTHAGRTQTRESWAKEFGISTEVLRGRLRLGWSVEDALSAKPFCKNPKTKLSKTKATKENQ